MSNGGWTKINNKLLQANVSHGQSVLARRGSMLSYRGDVHFQPTGTLAQALRGGGGMGGGMGGMLTRMVSGESAPMMECSGQGEVLYGHAGLNVHLVELQGDQLQVEADRLLAYPSTMQSSVVLLASPSGGGGGGGIRGALRGAARGVVTGQGMATTVVSGVGPVAILSHGPVFELHVQGQPVHVDPQAYVGHRGQLQVEMHRAGGMRDLVGAGADEAIQLRLTGQGTVFVQASEVKL